jgi:hypothetical protein
MIVTSQATPAITSGTTETYQASIAMNEVTFDLMMSGIYENKVLAPSRELICNARDSHVEAGKTDLPILIHAPTLLEPYFSVTDRGLGMSKETVTKLYMCLGESTKRNNNQAIGAFGIGSKAPFALTDAFQVTSVFNGVKTTYHIYKNRGLPDISVMFESETSEGNGTEVKFSVHSELIKSFNNNLKYFLKFFDFPFEINDENLKSEYPNILFTYQEDNVKVELVSSQRDCGVLMGGVIYQSNYLNSKDVYALVTLPIGSCKINPGREKTIEGESDGGFKENLKSFYTKAINTYVQDLNSRLVECKTLKEVSQLICGLPQELKSVVYREVTEKIKELDVDRFLFGRKGYFKRNSCSVGIRTIGKSVHSARIKLLTTSNIKIFISNAKDCKLRAKEVIQGFNDILVIVQPEEVEEYLQCPALADAVIYASDIKIDKDFEVKQPKEKRVITRNKGHKIYHVNSEGILDSKWLSKQEIELISDFLVYEGKQDSYIKTCYSLIKRNSYNKDWLNVFNVTDFYILSEKQAKWCKGNKLTLTKDNSFVKNVYYNLLYNSKYNEYVEEINYLYKLMGCHGRKKMIKKPPSVKVTNLSSGVVTYFKLNTKVEKEVSPLKDEYNDLYNKFMAKYPMISLVNKSLEELVDNKHVKQYIMDIEHLNKQESV